MVVNVRAHSKLGVVFCKEYGDICLCSTILRTAFRKFHVCGEIVPPFFYWDRRQEKVARWPLLNNRSEVGSEHTRIDHVGRQSFL